MKKKACFISTAVLSNVVHNLYLHIRPRARHTERTELCAHLKMALFSRANSNAFSLLNHCYCKKIAMGTSRLKSRTHASISSTIVQHKNDKLSKAHENFTI